MNEHHHVRQYLRALAALCMEVADRPELLPEFIMIIMRVPRTLAGMLREARRIAA